MTETKQFVSSTADLLFRICFLVIGYYLLFEIGYLESF